LKMAQFLVKNNTEDSKAADLDKRNPGPEELCITFMGQRVPRKQLRQYCQACKIELSYENVGKDTGHNVSDTHKQQAPIKARKRWRTQQSPGWGNSRFQSHLRKTSADFDTKDAIRRIWATI
ncbi:hypothetical protein FOL46_005522, partial [Perkinsus olseni]